jgi:hypothetical protein
MIKYDSNNSIYDDNVLRRDLLVVEANSQGVIEDKSIYRELRKKLPFVYNEFQLEIGRRHKKAGDFVLIASPEVDVAFLFTADNVVGEKKCSPVDVVFNTQLSFDCMIEHVIEFKNYQRIKMPLIGLGHRVHGTFYEYLKTTYQHLDQDITFYNK